jgi:hypothetical protein
MPSVVPSPQVQTANGENMYLPITKYVVTFPGGPIVVAPSADGSGLAPPFVIDTSVIVNGDLSVNGPTYINYDLNLSNPYVPTFDVAGDTNVDGEVIGRSLLIAQDTFKVPIGFHDFQGQYNLGATYCMDFGNSRWVWGQVSNVDSFGAGNAVLELNSVPANTFTNLENQNVTGLFDPTSPQKIVAMGALNSYVAGSLSAPFFYGILTMPLIPQTPPFPVPPFDPGNIVIWFEDPDSKYNVSFLAIGPPNTA